MTLTKEELTARRRTKATRKEAARELEYNARLAAEKTKTEKKSRKSMAKYHAEIKRNGKKVRAPALTPAPIQRIKAGLSIWEETAADEIMEAYCKAVGATEYQDADFDRPLAALRFGAVDERMAHQSDLARTYQEWRRSLADTVQFAVANSVLFAEIPLYRVDRQHRWQSGTAKKHLLSALRHFAALRGNTPRGVKDWKLSR